ncbi:unnamed protein product [Sympodiomycopsis kandeliae]
MVAQQYKKLLWAMAPMGLAAISVMAQPIAGAQDHSSTSPFQKRADIEDSNIVLIGGEAPQGPIVLVFGALGIAFLCLIFAIIRATTSSGKHLTGERNKAKTDLRLRGGQVSPSGSRLMLNSTVQSPMSTPLVSRSDLVDGSSASTVVAGKRSSSNRPTSHAPRGYSGSSMSRMSGMKSTYTSYSGNSMTEIPMLNATGRTQTQLSNSSGSSGEPTPAMGPRGAKMVAGPRRQMRNAPSGHRHSTSTVYRGTDLYLARANSGVGPVMNPSAVDAAYSPRASSPNVAGSSDLKRYVSDSKDHSRRNSAAGLLDDDPFTPLSPHHSAPTSADHSSGILSPTKSHPLTGNAPSAPPSWASHQSSTKAPPYPRQANGPTSADHSRQARPGAGNRGSNHRDRNAGFFQYGGRADEENHQGFEQLRPGQLAQPVLNGNGRRGHRGQPTGKSFL